MTDQDEPDGAQVVRALFAAHGAGALEEMLGLVHPEVIWEPSAPVRSFYLGREGTLALVSDLADVFGDFYVDVQESPRSRTAGWSCGVWPCAAPMKGRSPTGRSSS